MNEAAHAEDAVSVRRAVCRGMSELDLRRQLAAVPTPRVRHFVFVRRVKLRAEPRRIGVAMQAAVAKLAVDSSQEVLTFADFPTLAVACAKAALSGGLQGEWHWRMLGLPLAAGPGEAVATLLAAHPLEAASAAAALADAGLLGEVWRSLPEADAGRLIFSLALAAGFGVPRWPEQVAIATMGAAMPAYAATLLTRTAAMWASALPLTPRTNAALSAATLSLLRWWPNGLRDQNNPVWPALLTRLTQASPQAIADPRAKRESAAGAAAEIESEAAPPIMSAALRQAASHRHGEEIDTEWGGVLFLINALQRLNIASRLSEAGSEAPSGWRVLLDLALALGLPEDDPIARFLTAQDLDTTVPPLLLASLLIEIETLYRPDGPWPLPLRQPGRLFATETHLDLDLSTMKIDVELRLAGLDLDPGWVPWLGRVVAFHYDAIQTHDRRD
ncbi:MAG TPA: hypothetical protein VGN21_09250 [Stellaceae bacterium]